MDERETVSVGCRLPNGLQLHVMQRTHGDPPFKDRGMITLDGLNSRHTGQAFPTRTEAFTAVDKELFDIWYEENKDGGLVTGGAVFMPVVEQPKGKEPEAKPSKPDQPKAEPFKAKEPVGER